MRNKIKLLDCTLRDGGHIVEGKFGESVIRNLIKGLVEAKVDIIEIGFLWEKVCEPGMARFRNIEEVKRLLPKDKGVSKFSLMADYIDLEHLEQCDGTIEIIRLSFKRWRLDWGLKTAKILMDKGYKVFINPVNNNVYTDKQYIEVLDKVNELKPFGFSIVDTFGVMRTSDLSHRYYLVENNLHPDITIGIHLHENLGLAYNLAQHIVQIANPKRNIVIDGSLLGMGRIPGNLCIEQIMDYMNEKYGINYMLEPIYDLIDDYIAPIKADKPWGYAIPYAISAKFYLHRTYAEYLMKKERLKTKDIQRILSCVDLSEAETFNESYIEDLYLKYMNVVCEDKKDYERLRCEFSQYNKILIIAPGSSLISESDKISKYITEGVCVVSINFVPDYHEIVPDYVFVTNMKRYKSINEREKSKLIITSNLLRDVLNYDYVVGYNDIAYFEEMYCDDSTMMFLNLLNKFDVKEVMFAGFDGKRNGEFSFVDDSFGSNKARMPEYDKIVTILNNYFKSINKIFITESEYQ